MAIDVRPIPKIDAKNIILPNHYSHKWATYFGNTQCFGVFSDNVLVGAAAYGRLMLPKSYKSIGDVSAGQVCELNRLWIDDCLGRNTESQVISQSLKWLRHNTDIQIVQTFADGRLGCGTIYKASNARYYGKHVSMFFRNTTTGEVIHDVIQHNTAASAGMLHCNEWFCDNVAEAFTTTTFRYAFLLTNYAKRAMKLKEEPYPEYSIGEDVIPNYVPRPAVMARCVV